MLIAAVIAARFGVAAERKPLESVARPLAAAVAQPGSIVQETAAEIDQGIAAAARDDVDHPADDDSGSKMVGNSCCAGHPLRDPNWLLGGGFCRSRCWLGYHYRIGNRLRNIDRFRAGLMGTNHARPP
jgi:hypothetical protein